MLSESQALPTAASALLAVPASTGAAHVAGEQLAAASRSVPPKYRAHTHRHDFVVEYSYCVLVLCVAVSGEPGQHARAVGGVNLKRLKVDLLASSPPPNSCTPRSH